MNNNELEKEIFELKNLLIKLIQYIDECDVYIYRPDLQEYIEKNILENDLLY